MRKNLIFVCILSLLSLGGCTSILPTPHKIDIQQGNRIKQEDLDKLHLGMNSKQVKYVLGSPLLQDPFHKNRWDYIYYFKTGKGEVRQSRLRLDFENDKLVNIDTSHYHPEQQVDSRDEKVQQDDISSSRGGGGHSH